MSADWQIDVSTDSRLDVHQDAFGKRHSCAEPAGRSPISPSMFEGLIETHDKPGGRVERAPTKRFPPSLFPALNRSDRSQSGDGGVLPRETAIRNPRAMCSDFSMPLMMQINEPHGPSTKDPTNSGTSAVEAFLRSSAGSARDYAHIFIACARLRAAVPARFVAGHFLRSERHGQPAGRPCLGGRRSCPISAGSVSTPRQRHLHHRRATPASPSAWITSARPRCAGHALWRRYGKRCRSRSRSIRPAGRANRSRSHSRHFRGAPTVRANGGGSDKREPGNPDRSRPSFWIPGSRHLSSAYRPTKDASRNDERR